MMKATFKLLMGGEYISHINNLSVSLCKQQTLIAYMQFACLNNTIHWVVMGSLTSWFLQKCIHLNKFFARKREHQIKPID
jgi:hypothetical protein